MAASNPYAVDGICHTGPMRKQCLRAATWLGSQKNGYTMGFCDKCKENSEEAQFVVSWQPITEPVQKHTPRASLWGRKRSKEQ